MAVKSVSLSAVPALLVLLLFSAAMTGSTTTETSTAEGSVTGAPSDSVNVSTSASATSSPSTMTSTVTDSSSTSTPVTIVTATSAATSTAAPTASVTTSSSTNAVTNVTEATASSSTTVTSSPSTSATTGTTVASTTPSPPVTTPKVSTEGEPCNSTTVCDVTSSLQCVGMRCVCDNTSFWNNTHCVSGKSARPGPASAKPGGRGTLQVMWSAPVVGPPTLISGYRLHWNTHMGDNDSVEISNTTSTYTIKNLTSGSDYTVEIITFITYRGQNLISDPERISGRLLSYEGENCSSNGDCMNVTNLVCLTSTSDASLCRCNNGSFWMGNACHPIEELTPADVSTDSETTHSFRVRWTSSVMTEYNVSYLVAWYDVTGQQTEQPLNVSVVPKDANNSYVIFGLTPGAAYNVTVKAWLDEGFRSQNTTRGSTVTASLYPAIPGTWLSNESIVTSTSVNLTIQGVSEGFADQYNVTLGDQVKTGTILSSGSDVRVWVYFDGLSPGQNYSLSVAAQSRGKQGMSSHNSVRTQPAPASKVTSMSVTAEGREMTVYWSQPDYPNGFLFAYVLQVFEGSTCLRNYVFNCTSCTGAELVAPPTGCARPEVLSTLDVGTVSHKVEGLEPYRTYSLKVSAYNDAGQGIETVYNQRTDADVPPKFDESSVRGQGTSQDTSLSISVCVSCLLNERNGPLTLTGVVFHLGLCTDGKLGLSRKEAEYKAMQIYASDLQSVSKNVMRATRDDFTDELRRNQGGVVLVTVDSLSQGEAFCVAVYACTTAGCTESQGFQFRTNPSRTPAIIGGVVGGLLAALVLVVVVLVIMRMRRMGPFKQKIGRGRHSLIVTKPPTLPIQRKRPVRLGDFHQHVALMHKDSNRLFSMEFEDLGEVSVRHPRDCGLKEDNALKNRYTNILPFDHSRVKLVPLTEEDSSDYINANYLPGYNMIREYIATQGPLENTVADFWRMVWDQKSRIIVSLSALVEGGRPKVDLYWPEKVHEPQAYGAVEVVMTNEFLDEKLVIRTFKISLDEESRTVKQFFLPGWEDYSANLTPDDVIEFIRTVRLERKPDDPNPMVVHCSAGVGRTGTFIALDVVQQFIRDKDQEAKLDIFALVLRMRDCREYMVQTEKQYVFVHDTTIEILNRKQNPEEEPDHDYINMERGEDNQAFVREDDISVSMESEKSQV